MKATVLNGSARGKKGVTWRLLERLVAGVTAAGGTATDFQVADMNISPCRACLTCMHKRPGFCAVKDDMTQIHDDLKTSDVLVLGTPVYVDNMSAQLKAAMDRCICCMEPFLRIDGDDRVRHPYSWRMPAKFLLVATSGFPEAESFAPLIVTYKAQAANFGCKPIGEICVPGSIALQIEPACLEGHLEMVEEAGRLLAVQGTIDQSLLEKINTPPLTRGEYLKVSPKYEDWCRKHRNLG